MVPTPVLLAHAPGDAAQAELRANNPFGLRSTGNSTSTLPSQGQTEGTAEGDSLWVGCSLLRVPRRARPVMEGHVSSTTEPAESPMKGTSKATPEEVQVGDDDRQSVPTRQHSA